VAKIPSILLEELDDAMIGDTDAAALLGFAEVSTTLSRIIAGMSAEALDELRAVSKTREAVARAETSPGKLGIIVCIEGAFEPSLGFLLNLAAT
jgi:hypothetical protein